MSLKPTEPVPSLVVKTLDHWIWNLQEHQPERFTLIVFYRGLHCPTCKEYLHKLSKYLRAFEKEGVKVIAISSDPQDRALCAQKEWKLGKLPIGYEFPIEKAMEWGLHISEPLASNWKKKVPAPQRFIEPGIFIVDKYGRLYASVVQTMPFARPSPDEILKAIKFIKKEHYPARGDAQSLIPGLVSETQVNALKQVQEALFLAGEELQRMGDEGGSAPNKEQMKQVHTYLKASERIKKILPLLESGPSKTVEEIPAREMELVN